MKLRTWALIGFLLLGFMTPATYVVGSHLLQTSSKVARKLGTPLPIRVAVAQQTKLTETLGATGEVHPIAMVDLTATMSARIDKVAVDLGDLVTPKQPLLHFDRDLVNAALATAKTAFDQAEGDRQRAALYQQRITAVYQQGLLPKIEVEKAQAALDEATTKYRRAQEKLLHAKKDLQNAILRSPVAGVVMERQINPGETPRLHQKLFTLGRIDHVLVVANIAEERVAEISPGQPATVTLTAFPNDVFEGIVVKVKPVIDPKTRTFAVYTKVANPKLKLKPGLTAFTRIQREHEVLAVPSVSLINPTGVQESTVFVLEDGATARLRRVKVGVVAEGMTEILHGLTEGESVVVVGQLALRDGDQVVIGDEFKELKPQVAQKRQTP
ncbi:MAG TPA: efflux RND transporter periplasmic adaptor subunit [Alphaproteobacteria bacterium]|nr:efflux RND transporter periplasmic adaptor subunit [Alphaproteobacteria bacterium]